MENAANLWVAVGAVGLVLAGVGIGVLLSRVRLRVRGAPPVIRRNRLVWQIFQWLVIALGVVVAALVPCPAIFDKYKKVYN